MITETEMMEQITEVFRDVFDDDNLVVTKETNANEIEDWDSLAQIRLVAAIGKTFDVTFELGELNHLKNVGEMVDLIAQKKKND